MHSKYWTRAAILPTLRVVARLETRDRPGSRADHDVVSQPLNGIIGTSPLRKTFFENIESAKRAECLDGATADPMEAAGVSFEQDRFQGMYRALADRHDVGKAIGVAMQRLQPGKGRR